MKRIQKVLFGIGTCLLAVLMFTACSKEKHISELATIQVHFPTYAYKSMTMSVEETARLQKIFGESKWEKVNIEEDIVLDVDKELTYELVFEGESYFLIILDDQEFEQCSYPLRMENENGELLIGFSTDNQEFLKEIRDMINNRVNVGTDYEVFMEQNSKKSDSAIVRYRSEQGEEEYQVDKEDVERLRELLKPEAGWYQFGYAMRVGDKELILDNIRYVIDDKDLDVIDSGYQFKYGVIDDFSPDYAWQNDDIEVINEICEIVNKYLPQEE